VLSYISVFLEGDVELSVTHVYTSNVCSEIQISAIECLSIAAAKFCVWLANAKPDGGLSKAERNM